MSAVIAVIRSRNHIIVSEPIQLQSPFALSPAIKFAFGFAALSVVSKFLNQWAGVIGVYAISLSGFISSAVVTASAASLAVSGNVAYSTAALTAVLASIVSTGSKMMLVKFSGPRALVGMINQTFTKLLILGTFVLIVWGIFINL
jgi:uncharacterized membrane protein (DUF4010 family)